VLDQSALYAVARGASVAQDKNMTRPYLEIKGLKKSFALKPILRGIDLELNQGERWALMGANGAGKTTLLRILAGLTAPSAGSVRIDGLDLVQDAQRVRRLVGFVGHQPYLYDDLTALENLHFFGRMYAVKDAQQRARALLHRVGLEKRAQERVNTLSRGQVQRLALARALLHSPRLLLLDEPDTGLDEQGNKLLETLVDEHVAQDGAVLFATHQLEHAQKLADSIITLDNGRILSTRRGGGSCGAVSPGNWSLPGGQVMPA
jgi:heme ABC exporter ATP-binding subunit CcmA